MNGGVAHLVPRSMALVSPPVCLDRWNLRSRFKRCSKVSLATLRTACCPMLAKTAFRSSEKRVAPILAAPSEITREVSLADVKSVHRYLHPRMIEPATTQTVSPEVISRLRVSTTALKRSEERRV